MLPDCFISRCWRRCQLVVAGLGLAFSTRAQQAPATSPFWQQQLTFGRVRAAHAARWARVRAYLYPHKLDPARLEIFIRAFKMGQRVEAWGRALGSNKPFVLLHTYRLAGTSGTLGPKWCAGDGQIPEGLYAINRFHPQSQYHLSLGLDYPSAADRARSAAAGYRNPGNDIFIHGSNVTIGCLPITNAGIEELYLLAVAARASGQPRIMVHIFPFELTTQELSQRAAGPNHLFWLGLKPAYAQFAQTHTLPDNSTSTVAVGRQAATR